MSSPRREQNESVEQPKQRAHCANNCGFLSNEACSGLCSKCYQASLERERREAAAAENKEDEQRQAVSMPKPCGESVPAKAVAVLTEAAAVPFPVTSQKIHLTHTRTEPLQRKPAPKRCKHCSKKVGLTGFNCKCGEVFCGKHRHADAHACPFDHRGAERALLALQNPVIKGAKLEKL